MRDLTSVRFSGLAGSVDIVWEILRFAQDDSSNDQMPLMSDQAREVDWEVLPPEEKRKRAELEPLFRWLATIMDEFVRVPGTKFRFGLDPLIGLLPGIGDTGLALISAFALIQAARRGVPKILLARMSLNILLNEIIGIIPIVGDAFSFWFKSNARNYELLRRHGAAGQGRRTDWIFVSVVLVLLALAVVAGMVVTFLVLRAIARALGSH